MIEYLTCSRNNRQRVRKIYPKDWILLQLKMWVLIWSIYNIAHSPFHAPRITKDMLLWFLPCERIRNKLSIKGKKIIDMLVVNDRRPIACDLTTFLTLDNCQLYLLNIVYTKNGWLSCVCCFLFLFSPRMGEKEIILLYTWWRLAKFCGEIEQMGPRMAGSMNTWVVVGSSPSEHVLDGWGLQQSFQHATRASMLETFVRRQGVFRPIPAVAEFTYVQRVGLFVFVLKVSLEWVIARESSSTVGTFLRLIDTTTSGWRHSQWCKLRWGRCRDSTLLSCWRKEMDML